VSEKSVLKQLQGFGAWYWLKLAILLVLGALLGHYIGARPIWTGLRYKIYQDTFDLIQLIQAHGPLYPQRTALVLINDEEYWKGSPAGRVPINRYYLA
jgi:hypothetical protein